ncbi:MAG: protein-disulfide reductase DsbD domain-containing protein [Sedimentitalea sp.]
MKQLALPLLALAASSLSAPLAAQSAMDDMVQLEVIEGGMTSRGTYQVAMRLTLSEGWKTYWRAPGDAGIPPQFDWRGSRNVGGASITWPTPEVFHQNGMRSIGYAKQLVLPIEISPSRDGKPVRIKGALEFGICKDVCVPATLRFDHRLDQQAPRHPAIAAALAHRPYSRTEAKVRSAVCSVAPIDGGLRLTAKITMPSAGGTEVTVIEPGNPKVWASESISQRQGNVLTASADLVHVEKGAYALDRSEVRITVLGAHHAVDILGCSPE